MWNKSKDKLNIRNNDEKNSYMDSAYQDLYPENTIYKKEDNENIAIYDDFKDEIDNNIISNNIDMQKTQRMDPKQAKKELKALKKAQKEEEKRKKIAEKERKKREKLAKKLQKTNKYTSELMENLYSISEQPSKKQDLSYNNDNEYIKPVNLFDYYDEEELTKQIDISDDTENEEEEKIEQENKPLEINDEQILEYPITPIEDENKKEKMTTFKKINKQSEISYDFMDDDKLLPTYDIENIDDKNNSDFENKEFDENLEDEIETNNSIEKMPTAEELDKEFPITIEDNEISELEAKVEEQKTVQLEFQAEEQEISEPETKVEGQEISEPEAKVENQEISEPGTKVEGQEISEPEAKVENQEILESEAKIEEQEISEPEAKVENQEILESEIQIEEQEISEPEVKIEDKEVSEQKNKSAETEKEKTEIKNEKQKIEDNDNIYEIEIEEPELENEDKELTSEKESKENIEKNEDEFEIYTKPMEVQGSEIKKDLETEKEENDNIIDLTIKELNDDSKNIVLNYEDINFIDENKNKKTINNKREKKAENTKTKETYNTEIFILDENKNDKKELEIKEEKPRILEEEKVDPINSSIYLQMQEYLKNSKIAKELSEEENNKETKNDVKEAEKEEKIIENSKKEKNQTQKEEIQSYAEIKNQLVEYDNENPISVTNNDEVKLIYEDDDKQTKSLEKEQTETLQSNIAKKAKMAAEYKPPFIKNPVMQPVMKNDVNKIENTIEKISQELKYDGELIVPEANNATIIEENTINNAKIDEITTIQKNIEEKTENIGNTKINPKADNEVILKPLYYNVEKTPFDQNLSDIIKTLIIFENEQNQIRNEKTNKQIKPEKENIKVNNIEKSQFEEKEEKNNKQIQTRKINDFNSENQQIQVSTPNINGRLRNNYQIEENMHELKMCMRCGMMNEITAEKCSNCGSEM